MLKMNSAKSYKILILIVAMVMSFVTAFALMVSKTAFAEDGEVFRPSYVNVYDQDDKCLDDKRGVGRNLLETTSQHYRCKCNKCYLRVKLHNLFCNNL